MKRSFAFAHNFAQLYAGLSFCGIAWVNPVE
jgi:hypothetical protein